MTITTPVALLIFNRPDTTRRVLEVLARVQPRLLLVAADGPRAGREGEAERCAETRAVTERITWDCEVRRQYSPTNLGCRRGVASGLDWVFQQVDEAIILEDDCVPDATFFPYCQQLLDRYRDDRRITAISGASLQRGDVARGYSYFFAQSFHCWGWATWRRAWQHYDDRMSLWPEVRDQKWLTSLLPERTSRRFWQKAFEAVYQRRIDTWDVAWVLACWLQNGLTIHPDRNLVTNVGFGPGATHTRLDTTQAVRPTVPMEFPLRHPPFVIRNEQADRYLHRTQFVSKPKHLLGLLQSWLRRAAGSTGHTARG